MKHISKALLHLSAIKETQGQLKITLPPTIHSSGLFLTGRSRKISLMGKKRGKKSTFVRHVPTGSDKAQLKWEPVLHGGEL